MTKPIPPHDEHLSYVPLDVLQTPKGRVECIAGRWWIVHPGKGAAIWRRSHPQCNVDKSITERVQDILYPWASVLYIEHAFVPVQDG